jgi:threonine dehydratase
MSKSAIDKAARPTAADIAAAQETLRGVAVRTPLVNAAVLDERLSARVFLKAETLQRTGSFKFRGAYNKIASIAPGKRAAGVVAYSSGNHAQGVAAAARLLGMRATIVMPADAPATKRRRTEALGAEVVPYDRDRQDRAAIGEALAQERGATLVPPYDDPLVIAGQGTIGAEIVEDLRALGLAPEIVVVGASGGGLAAGVALGVAAQAPSADMYIVEPQGFDDTLRSFASGRRETNPQMSGTLCDALMSATPGELTFPITRALIGKGFTVSDDDVAAAVRYAFQELKLVVEPGGAVGLAVLLAGKLDVKGKVAATILSGGNVDAELFAKIISGAPLTRTARGALPR